MDKLLSILSKNSDFDAKELSLMTGMSEDEVINKIKEYKEQGIICGYTALIDFNKIESSVVTALIELKVTPQRDKGFEEIADLLSQYEEVMSVYLMAGPYDILLRVEGPSIQDVAKFVSSKIAPMDGILSTATHFMLKTYKENGVRFSDTDYDTDEREMVH